MWKSPLNHTEGTEFLLYTSFISFAPRSFFGYGAEFMFECGWPVPLLVLQVCSGRRVQEESTWLILPVVICLSQRLSHACLSITVILGNCEWLIKSVIVYLMVPYYSDNRSNSRANTCVNLDFGRDVFIRLKTNPSGPLVIHNNWTNRMGLPRRCFIQISALSRFDGSIEDYHASNG